MTDADLNALWELSEHLRGRSMPGVHMTEMGFDAWLDEDVRAEWIDGEVILLSPSDLVHIKLNMWLGRILEDVTDSEDAGFVFAEPQIRLVRVKQRRNPDVAFVSKSRQHILMPTCIDGAPHLVMEIVSPDSEARDWRDKYNAYEQSGVREYWVIDPLSKHVEVYSLNRNGKFTLIPEADGKIRSKVLKTLQLRPEWLWKSPLPKPAIVLKELGVRA